MASTRDIRRRIKSVKNTAQITKAMQMVAATKMRRAQQAAIALRPSSVYGPGRTTACFIRDMIDHSRRGEPLALAPAGVCRRQFVHVDDVVAAILGALRAPRLDDFAFNVGGGTWLSEQEIVAVAAPVLQELRIASTDGAARCLDGDMGPLDTTRARAALGFSPSVSLAEGVAAYAATLPSG